MSDFTVLQGLKTRLFILIKEYEQDVETNYRLADQTTNDLNEVMFETVGNTLTRCIGDLKEILRIE